MRNAAELQTHLHHIWDESQSEGCHADAPYEPMTCASEKCKCPRLTGHTIKIYSKKFSQDACCDLSDGTPPLRRVLVTAERARVALGFAVLITSSILLSAILSCRHATRSQAFNVYLVFLSMSDSLQAVGNDMHALNDQHVSCGFMYSFAFFYLTCNAWLNVILGHQVFVILQNSRGRRRTNPPALCRVFSQAGAVYLFAAGMGVWGGYMCCSGLLNYLDDIDKRL